MILDPPTTEPPALQAGGRADAPLTVGRLSNARRFAVWGIALVFTLLAVQWSERNGRLTQDPTYDDAQYLIDGAEKLQVLDRGGLTGLTADFVQHPPHSPFSTFLALASFETLGIKDWAPYAFNFIVVAAYLFLCCRAFGNLPPAAFYSLLVLCLTIPFALRAVHDFRPDFASALATAAFVWFGIAAALGEGREAVKHTVHAGLWLGAALWIKPPIFPHTVAIALVVGVGITAGRWLPGAPARTLKRGLLLALLFGTVGVVVAAPYYIVNGRQTFDYFRETTSGSNAYIYSFSGSLWSVLRVFVYDGAVALTIGRYLWLLLACIMVGLGWTIRRRRYRAAVQIAGLLFVAGTSLAIFVVGKHSDEHFGFYYQLLVLGSALAALSAVMRESRLAVRLAPALLVFALTPVLTTARGPFWRPAPEADPDYGWNRKIVSAIVSDTGYEPSRDAGDFGSIPVFVGFAGFVGSFSMQWIGVKEHLPFVFSDLLLSNDVSAQWKEIQSSAYVVACTPEAKSAYRHLPSQETFAPVLARLQGDPTFQEVRIGADPAPPYRLFRNTAQSNMLSSRMRLSIGWPVTGFNEIEGPYPQWHLPRVRWGTFPRSTITVTVPQASTGNLKFSATAPPGAVVRVTVNDQSAGEHVQLVARPESAEIPLPLRAGENIVALDYSFPDKAQPPGTLAFLYENFVLDTAR